MSSLDACVCTHRRHNTVLSPVMQPVHSGWLQRDTETVVDGRKWYRPTDAFWRAHCRASHLNGDQCNVDLHTQFLAKHADGSRNKNQEFYYATMVPMSGDAGDNNVTKTSVRVWSRPDFQRECADYASNARQCSFTR